MNSILEYGTHTSLDRFLSKFKKDAAAGFIVCPGNYEKTGRVVYFPAYMASWL